METLENTPQETDTAEAENSNLRDTKENEPEYK